MNVLGSHQDGGGASPRLPAITGSTYLYPLAVAAEETAVLRKRVNAGVDIRLHNVPAKISPATLFSLRRSHAQATRRTVWISTLSRPAPLFNSFHEVRYGIQPVQRHAA